MHWPSVDSYLNCQTFSRVHWQRVMRWHASCFVPCPDSTMMSPSSPGRGGVHYTRVCCAAAVFRAYGARYSIAMDKGPHRVRPDADADTPRQGGL